MLLKVPILPACLAALGKRPAAYTNVTTYPGRYSVVRIPGRTQEKVAPRPAARSAADRAAAIARMTYRLGDQPVAVPAPKK